MHPKLNWENFEATYSRRKQRRRRVAILLWSVLGLGVLLGSYFTFSTFKEEVYTEPKSTTTPITRSSESDVLKEQSSPVEHDMKNVDESPVEGTATSEESSSMSTSNDSEINKISLSKVQISPTAASGVTPISIEEEDVRAPQEIVSISARSLSTFSSYRELRKPMREFTLRAGLDSEDSNSMSNLNYAVQLSAVAYHSPWLEEREGRNYYSFISPSLSFQVRYRLSEGWELSGGIEWTMYRYQAQLVESYRTSIYKPGSIVGYYQEGNQFKPIYSDTVNGVLTRRYHENGNLQIISIPVRMRYALPSIYNIQMAANAGMDLNYLYSSSRAWMRNGRITTTTDAIGNQLFIPALQAGLELRYPIGDWGVFSEIR